MQIKQYKQNIETPCWVIYLYRCLKRRWRGL